MANDSVEPDTFPKLLLRNASQRGDHPAIREKRRGIWRTTTWRGLADEVSALAGALAARGLQRGAQGQEGERRVGHGGGGRVGAERTRSMWRMCAVPAVCRRVWRRSVAGRCWLAKAVPKGQNK